MVLLLTSCSTMGRFGICSSYKECKEKKEKHDKEVKAAKQRDLNWARKH